MSETPEKVIPPISHIIDPKELKPADHIYRRLCGIKSLVGYHHGIVYYVPDEYSINEIKIVEMSKLHGVRESTLPEFLAGWDCRLVYYNVPEIYEKLHASGTCHSEPKSDPKLIIRRCSEIKKIFEEINDVYSLFGLNCEHFALFCSTGIVHHSITYTQISRLLHKVEESTHCGHKVASTKVRADKVRHGNNHNTNHHPNNHPNNHPNHHPNHAHNSHHLHSTQHSNTIHHAAQKTTSKTAAKVATKASTKALAKAAAKSTATAVSKVVTANASTVTSTALDTATVTVSDTSKHIIKSISGCTVACFAGIAVGIETAFTIFRIYKYYTDINYLKEDLKWALIKGWTGTTAVVGVGIIGMLFGIGWWVLIPLIGVSVIITLLFMKFHKEKSYKEKVFIERGIKLDSSIADKREEIRKIKQEIKDEKLHPDKWPDDLSQNQKKKKMEKYLWLMSVKELIQQDIDQEYGLIDEESEGLLAITL